MKENFAILTDAGGDFTREIIAKYGIEETPMSTVVWPDGSERPTDLYWETMKAVGAEIPITFGSQPYPPTEK